ncbi:transcription factor Vhr1-domain-containing protein [Lipomyces arxii]|uniref:transcription factor Vhr1-domain-containing protein n=1 Tax=Lipomyces arxii TaxID=56418 RepID=UPI0034CF164B
MLVYPSNGKHRCNDPILNMNSNTQEHNQYSSPFHHLQQSRLPLSSQQSVVLPQSQHSFDPQYYTRTDHQQSRCEQSQSRLLRIECTGRVVQWNLDYEHLSLDRLHNYIQSAFFIESRQFSLRYKPLIYGEEAQFGYITDEASLLAALEQGDLAIEVLTNKIEEEPTSTPSYKGWQRSNSIDSVVMDYTSAAGGASRQYIAQSEPQSYSSTSPNTSPASISPPFHSSLSRSLSVFPLSTSDAMQRRKSSIFIPPPQKKAPPARVSGVTQTIRQKLHFVDEGQWKKFSARRLELIDSMELSSKKASEQDDVIIAVADTLRDEYGFPLHTLPDFDELVRAAIQSVRRNRKRLPKYTARSKAKSAGATSSDELARQRSDSVTSINSGTSATSTADGYSGTSSHSSPDLSKTTVALYPNGHFEYRPNVSTRRSEPIIVQQPTGVPTAPIAYDCRFSTQPFPSHPSAEENSKIYRASDRLRPSVSPQAPLTPVSMNQEPSSQAQILLELIHGGRATTCAINVTDLVSSTFSNLSFLLKAVRRTLALPADAPVALYYFRAGDGLRVQITSDADANLAMRTAQLSTGASSVQGFRVEVITMNEIQALHYPPARSVFTPTVPLLMSDSSRRISIGSLVGG